MMYRKTMMEEAALVPNLRIGPDDAKPVCSNETNGDRGQGSNGGGPHGIGNKRRQRSKVRVSPYADQGTAKQDRARAG